MVNRIRVTETYSQNVNGINNHSSSRAILLAKRRKGTSWNIPAYEIDDDATRYQECAQPLIICMHRTEKEHIEGKKKHTQK